jgi:hypothetical protein
MLRHLRINCGHISLPYTLCRWPAEVEILRAFAMSSYTHLGRSRDALVVNGCGTEWRGSPARITGILPSLVSPHDGSRTIIIAYRLIGLPFQQLTTHCTTHDYPLRARGIIHSDHGAKLLYTPGDLSSNPFALIMASGLSQPCVQGP